MGWLFGNDDNKKDQDEASTQPDLDAITEAFLVKRFEGADVARTRAIQAQTGMIYFRVAQKVQENDWQVFNVEIFDPKTKPELYDATLKAEGEKKSENDVVIKIRAMSNTTKYKFSDIGKDDTDKTLMTAVQAMALLADLEKRVLLNSQSYDYIKGDKLDGYKDQIEDKFVKLDQKNKALQTNFFEIEHFIDVSERENIGWTTDGEPRPLKHGRPTMDGDYMASDLNRAAEAQRKAQGAAKFNSMFPSELRELFPLSAQKNSPVPSGNLDTRLKALESLSVMDAYCEKLKAVLDEYKGLKEGRSTDWEALEDRVSDVLSTLDKGNVGSGLFVQELKNKLFFFEVEMYTLSAQDCLSKMEENPSQAKAYAKKIRGYQDKIVNLAKDYNLGEDLILEAKHRIENGFGTASSVDFIQELVDQYTVNRQAYVEMRQKDASLAESKRATILTKTRPNTP